MRILHGLRLMTGVLLVVFFAGVLFCVEYDDQVHQETVAQNASRAKHAAAFRHNQHALELLVKGDSKGAIEELKRATSIEPENPQNYFVLSTIFEEIGNTELQIANLKKSVELDPKNPVVHAKLASALSKSGDRVRSAYEFSLVRQLLHDLPRVDGTVVAPRNAIRGGDYYDQFGSAYTLGPLLQEHR